MSINFGMTSGNFQEAMDLIKILLPVIIPLAVIQIGLLIFALVDIARKRRTKTLSPLIWILIICLVSSSGIGAILYLILGRADSGVNSNDDI